LIADDEGIPDDSSVDILNDDDDNEDLIKDVADLGAEDDMLGVIDNGPEKSDDLAS